MNPKLLICDEATSALDVTVQKEIIELLGRLRKKRGGELSILFISHDLALVQGICDRIMVMYAGQFVEEGFADDVVNNPKNEYTKNLLASVLSV